MTTMSSVVKDIAITAAKAAATAAATAAGTAIVNEIVEYTKKTIAKRLNAG